MKTFDRPNIVHIITDQHSADALSCAGNPHVQTPNLDRLASEGMRFERAYASHPLCVSARASMLTGLYSFQTEYEDADGEYRPWTEAELRDRSIGWIMKRAGYEVPYAGKWHVVNLGVPADHGFDWILPEGCGYYAGQAELVNPACRAFFEKQRDTPFFLTASYIQPHGICFWGMMMDGWRLKGDLPWPEGELPWDEGQRGDGYPFPAPSADVPLAEFIQKNCPPLPENFAIPEMEPEILQEHYRQAKRRWSFRGNEKSGPLTEEQIWRLYRWTYFRFVEQADRQVGELLDMLGEFGLEENTVEIFTSDHGEANGCHQLKYKNFLYDECARVPFIVRHTGTVPAGVVDKEHIINNCLDLLPTVCQYADIERPAHCEGLSFRNLIEGRDDTWREETVIECRTGRALIGPRFKYARYEQSPDHPELLFDIREDPLETRNLAVDPEFAGILQECRGRFGNWLKANSFPALPRH